jgi:hypothetical protein
VEVEEETLVAEVAVISAAAEEEILVEVVEAAAAISKHITKSRG